LREGVMGTLGLVAAGIGYAFVVGGRRLWTKPS
jgi:hypothetical protein